MRLLNVHELPKDRQVKAAEIVRMVTTQPAAYAYLGGKRLVYDRNVIAVPLGGNAYRMMFRDERPHLKYCGTLTHQDFNNISRSTQTLRVMDPIYTEPVSVVVVNKPKEGPVMAEEETAPVVEKVARKKRNHNARRTIEDRIASLPVGGVVTALQLIESTNVSQSAVHAILRELEQAKKLEMSGHSGGRRNYRKVGDVAAKGGSTSFTAKERLERILDHVAALDGMIVPPTISSFSTAELAAELNRRLTAS